MNVELLNEFENIVVVYTLLDKMDLNYLDTKDMQEVLDIANECNIELNHYDLNANDPLDIYENWIETINNKYLTIKNKLLHGGR